MYCPDTLERLNESEVERCLAAIGAARPVCDYCTNPADHALPVYNPADGVRGVVGAYAVLDVCDECYENRAHTEENFYCTDCGELFILNHSWDVVAVTDRETGEMYCQKCFVENHLEGVRLGDLLKELAEEDSDAVRARWVRLNAVPGKEFLVEVEFSEWDDFPGCTSLECVAEKIREAADEAEIDLDVTVYPVITQGYQFSVVLAVYH